MNVGDAFKDLLKTTAANLEGDFSEFGQSVSTLAHKALSVQTMVMAQSLTGANTELAERALKAAYANLAVATSSKVAKATNAAWRSALEAAVDIAWNAAGLPSVEETFPRDFNIPVHDDHQE